MSRTRLTVFGIVLAVLIGSCGANNSETARETKQQTTPSDASKNNAKTEEVEKNKEKIEEDNNIEVPGLIPPTLPTERLKNISEGRQDPFSLIPLKPKPIQPKKEGQNTTRQPLPLTQQPEQQEPQPDLARDVVVTGVLTVGNVTKAIIKAPNEKFSRHVDVGQYLSNGKVRVKRIDINSTPPVVVLEQSGKEVYKRVGEQVSASPQQN